MILIVVVPVIKVVMESTRIMLVFVTCKYVKPVLYAGLVRVTFFYSCCDLADMRLNP